MCGVITEKATTGDMAEARRRHSIAFGPVNRIKTSKLTKADVATINGAIEDRMAILVPARERIANNFAVAMVEEFTSDLADLMAVWKKHDVWGDLSSDAAALYLSLRKKGEPESHTRAALHAYLVEHADGVDKRIDRIIRRAPISVFNGDVFTVKAFFVLFAELGGAFITRALKGEFDVITKQLISTYTKASVTKAEELLVQITCGEGDFPPLPASAQMSELAQTIASRANQITLNGFTPAMFETLRDTIKTNLYDAMEGGAGAEEIARKLGQDLSVKFGSALPPEAKNRLMLWARTEGCVMQNDALMKRGSDLGMDGKIWQNVGDSRVRTQPNGGHVANGGQGVIPVTERFIDGSLDAGSGSVSPFNCFHPEQEIVGDYLNASRISYSGDMFAIQTRKGNRVVCTPNHPILTTDGFKFARLINKGDNLVCGPPNVTTGNGATREQNKQNTSTRIENVFEAFRKCGDLFFRNVSSLDFYEDGRVCNGDIQTVIADSRSHIRNGDAALQQRTIYSNLSFTPKFGMGTAHLMQHGPVPASHFFPSNFFLFAGRSGFYSHNTQSRVDGHAITFKKLRDFVYAFLFDNVHFSQYPQIDNNGARFSAGTYGDPVFAEKAVYDLFAASALIRQLYARFSSAILLDDVIDIHVFPFSGFVYDVESSTGLMVTRGGVICKQCRCVCGPALLTKSVASNTKPKTQQKPTKPSSGKSPKKKK